MLLALALLPACPSTPSSSVPQGTSTTTGATTTATTSTGGAGASSSGADTTAAAASSGGGDGTIDAQCSIWDQDCPAGEKCAPWSAEPDLVPDEIRCCPEVAQGREPGETCVIQDYLGSCLDDCVKGSMCLDFDGDGMGTCQKYCQGSAEIPACELDQGCLIYFAGVPFCFDTCDPLLQDCPEGDGCYPDEEQNGGTGFLCLPTIGAGAVGDLCFLLSGCAPGLFCVTPEFFPDCNENFGCCTPMCDITDSPDPCPTIDPRLACVSWYSGGQMPPDIDYADVGVCVIPP